MRFVFIFCSVLMSLAVKATPLDSVRAEERKEGLVIIHQVEEDETLYSIARRYKGSVASIIRANSIVDNRIEIGQILEIPVSEKSTNIAPGDIMPPKDQKKQGFHLVGQGETLYSISKLYDTKVKDLKKWNKLEGNAISPGMYLSIAKEDVIAEETVNERVTVPTAVEDVKSDSVVRDPFEDFEKYLVQTGETLYTIATKIGTSVDSLRSWNGLTSNYLKIGQEIMFKGIVPDSALSAVDNKKPGRTQIDEDGFEKVVEEGIASVIESMETKRYLALHRSLPIGTELEVRNLMNNQVVHVKVVGRLPNTGLNENLLIRLSSSAYKRLGILDPKSRVEVSYYKE